MIAFIQGTVASYGADYIVVDHQGFGWQVAYPHTDEVRLNQEIRVYTYMHVTENDVSLFGFSSQEEKELFLRLISVKGLGPKTAMNMLASAGYAKIIAAIEEGNVAVLKKMPGIGAKSASQIVLDLKGKLVAVPAAKKAETPEYPDEIKDALDALKSLGYKPNEVSSAAAVMMQSPGLKTQEYLRMGLKHLGKA
ncbi:MAG TPA: Holliday junction branch migration protein RuvA [Erysipelotrichaceae bacterium]|jgi:Holliday junction DNA helicase RuvA|nr:Holliday junction branch migration protein RuvA [Erysipelotrichaceae bacterium]